MARDGVGVIESEKLKWSDLEQSKLKSKGWLSHGINFNWEK